MKRTVVLQEIRQMRFEEAYEGWHEGRLSQEEAARILGICDRSFSGIETGMRPGDGGAVRQTAQPASHRRAPVDEVMALTEKSGARMRDRMRGIFTAGIGAQGQTQLHLGKEAAAGGRGDGTGQAQGSAS